MKKPDFPLRVLINQDGTFDENPQGRFFLDTKRAVFTDLTGVQLLRCGVDTVRQLYQGLLRPEVLCLFDRGPRLVEFAGHNWHASKIGKDSGYQYKLQNADFGLVLLVKNFTVKQDSIGPHLKIEVSPHLIDSLAPHDLQTLLDDLAKQILTVCEPRQCAVHLALDVQGWFPPDDFQARVHSRARNVRRFDGVKSFEFDEKSAVYGAGQSFLWGSAGAVQLAVYDKTKQARAIDKLDFWRGVWSRDCWDYNPDLPVWRIEFRFHHSVVDQFADGSFSTQTGAFIDSRTYKELAPHLDGLFRYGLDNFAFLARPGLVDPFWSLIRQDVRVDASGTDSLVAQTFYKRRYKTASGFSGKNIDLMVGNAISLAARQCLDANQTVNALRSLPFFDLIFEHYQNRGFDFRGFKKMIAEKLAERVVRYGVAV